MKKKRMLAWMLALLFALTAPLPGMTNEVHAESQENSDECTTHNPMEQAYDISAGCTEPGYTNAVRCYDCGKILSYDDVIPPTGHSYTTHKWEWIHATCTEEGELEWMCDNPGCGQTERYTLPPLGHVPVPCAEEPASCLYEGSTGGTMCSRCQEMLVEPDVIPALGHDFSRVCTEWGATCARPAGYRNCCSREGCMAESTEDNYIGEPHDIHMWTRDSYGGTGSGDWIETWSCVICGETHTGKTGPAGSGHILSYEDKYPTCTEDGYKDRLMCSCHDQVFAPGVTRPAWGHSFMEITLEDPDCSNSGRAYKICQCGERTEEYELPPLGHSWYADYGSAGCTDNGVWRCRYCPAINDTVEAEPRGHDWVTIHTVPASGDQPGKEIQYCTRCGTRQDIITEATEGHDWETTVNYAATCSDSGLSTKVCRNCGKREYITQPALGHDWERVGTRREATCLQMGTSDFRCTREGCGATKWEIDLPVVPHSFTKQEIIKPATCLETGRAEIYCIWCGEYEKDVELPIADHTWVPDTIIQEPTCTEPGKAAVTCSVCGAQSEEEPLPALGHNWEQKVLQEPDCTHEGRARDECGRCGAVGEERTLPAEGHEWVSDIKDASCTEWGWRRTYCSVCNQTEEIVDIEPYGHEWEDFEVIREANCTTEGLKRLKCKWCDEQKEETIPTNDEHDIVKDIIAEPDCIMWGEMRIYCSRCGYESVNGLVPPTGHFPVTVDEKGAGCMEDSYIGVVRCSVCNALIAPGTLKPAIGHHSWGDDNVLEPSTCTTRGRAQDFCTVCGKERIRDLPIEPHDWQLVSLYAPTCVAEGAEQWECQTCGRRGRVEYVSKSEEHKWLTRQGKEATCSEPGYTESISCELCGKIQKYPEPIPTTPHKEVIIHSMRPTSTLEGRTEGIRCERCGIWIIECKTLPKLAPERTENDVSEQPAGWAKGSDETASFRSEADIDEFSHVAVDGEMVNESNYDLKEGSTIVIFKPEYLETLPLGEHEVEIVSIASSAFGTLNITSKEALAALLEQEAREALAAQEIQPAQEADAAARGLGNSYYYILPALIILLAGGVFLVLHKRRMAK